MKYRGKVRPPKHPLYEVLDNGAWRGQRAFLVGGGPSLRGFDFERLRGERVIAINAAFLEVPFADICFFMDYTAFLRWIKDNRLGLEAKRLFYAFKGYRVYLDLIGDREEADVYTLRSSGDWRTGLNQDMRNGLYHGNNSGYGALNLAYCLGANPIYLLGYDMGYTGPKAHYHTHYPQPYGNKSTGVFEAYTHSFQQVAPTLKKLGVRVINLNPRSGLRCFEFGDAKRVLQ